MVVQVAPAFVETCHWTDGIGEPEAAALNEAVDPAATVSLEGSEVIVGALGDGVVTVRVAASVVTLPAELVNTASYSSPFCDEEAVRE